MKQFSMRWFVCMGQWVCPHCYAGPFESNQFTCSNCGRGKNG